METTRNPNPTPKMVFLSSGVNISEHRKLVDSAAFQRAIEVAQRQYVKALTATAPADLTQPNHVVASGMCFQRIQGMHDFITILTNLSELPSKQQATEAGDNLKPQN